MNEQLTAALRAEYAAIFAYGVIGARLKGDSAATARAAESAHRDRRDSLTVLLSGDSARVPAAEPAYALPFPVTDRVSALRLAIEIETRTAAVWRAVLPVTTGERRRQALDGLTDCAVRAVRWRRVAGITPATVVFPGRPA
ncbi:MAG TPA: ferritin-like domain-containing protein [Micromonosporaceae bacterium]